MIASITGKSEMFFCPILKPFPLSETNTSYDGSIINLRLQEKMGDKSMEEGIILIRQAGSDIRYAGEIRRLKSDPSR
jgi:hypothetical protein